MPEDCEALLSIALPAPRTRPVSWLWHRTSAATSRLASYRRGLQITLGLVWLLDAALQYQPYMFTRDFVTQIIAPTAAGNPMVIAHPLTWAAHIMLHHIALYNAIFATIQLGLALGMFWPRTVKAALAASVVWSLSVWWFGEGLGGILTSPTSDPFMGAPGGVILYAFIAILVWPRDHETSEEPTIQSVATMSPIGARAANVLWLSLWLSSIYMLLQPVNRAPHSLGSMITGMRGGTRVDQEHGLWFGPRARAAMAPESRRSSSSCSRWPESGCSSPGSPGRRSSSRLCSAPRSGWLRTSGGS